MRIFVLAVIAAALFSSCRKAQSPEFRELKNISLQKLPFGTKQAELTADILLFNPNPFSVELKESDLDLYIGEQFLGKAKQTGKIRVPAKQTFSLPVSVRILSSILLQNSMKFLSNDPVLFGAKGSVSVGKAGVYKKIDIDYKGLHTLPKFSLF